jgi:hypothetical protein
MRLLVLTTYYFMTVLVTAADGFSLTTAQQAVLLSICEEAKREEEESRLMLRPSRLVKLHIRIPGALLASMQEYETKTVQLYRGQRNDSGVEEMDCGRITKVSNSTSSSPADVTQCQVRRGALHICYARC